LSAIVSLGYQLYANFLCLFFYVQLNFLQSLKKKVLSHFMAFFTFQFNLKNFKLKNQALLLTLYKTGTLFKTDNFKY